MDRKQGAVLAILAVLAALLFPLLGWFYIGTEIPGLHIRTVALNGTIITCGRNGTCVYDNTIDIFNAPPGGHALFGPLQVAFFVGALTGALAVALVLVFLMYFTRARPGRPIR